MMKKILFVAHMDSHIANFHLPYLKWFKEQSYETHVASNSKESTRDILYCDKKHQIDFSRSPFSLSNFKTYKAFKKLVKEEKFDLVHCHTPMGGLFTRLAFRKTKTPVFYTAHGFHFLKGGSKLSWLLYYPIEKWLSRYTNELLTINYEDFTIAKKKFSKKCNVSYVPGVGVDLASYYTLPKEEITRIRKEMGLEDKFVLTYVAEQTKGKNQGFIIDFVSKAQIKYHDLRVLLIGYGEESENYAQLIKEKKLEKKIFQLGFRKDINELNNIADVVISTSLREGLPKALLEAIAIGKPILASDIRGNKELVLDGYNGFLYPKNDIEAFEYKLDKLYKDSALRERFSMNSKEHSLRYDISLVLDQVTGLYNKYLGGGQNHE